MHSTRPDRGRLALYRQLRAAGLNATAAARCVSAPAYASGYFERQATAHGGPYTRHLSAELHRRYRDHRSRGVSVRDTAARMHLALSVAHLIYEPRFRDAHTEVAPARADGMWETRAACRSEDPEIFYVSRLVGSRHPSVQDALAVCARCPVRAECLADDHADPQPNMIRGGMTPRDRGLANVTPGVAS